MGKRLQSYPRRRMFNTTPPTEGRSKCDELKKKEKAERK